MPSLRRLPRVSVHLHRVRLRIAASAQSLSSVSCHVWRCIYLGCRSLRGTGESIGTAAVRGGASALGSCRRRRPEASCGSNGPLARAPEAGGRQS
eukprot:scaffold14014_cov146-Isochrysis_galbana.AAC.2